MIDLSSFLFFVFLIFFVRRILTPYRSSKIFLGGSLVIVEAPKYRLGDDEEVPPGAPADPGPGSRPPDPAEGEPRSSVSLLAYVVTVAVGDPGPSKDLSGLVTPGGSLPVPEAPAPEELLPPAPRDLTMSDWRNLGPSEPKTKIKFLTNNH